MPQGPGSDAPLPKQRDLPVTINALRLVARAYLAIFKRLRIVAAERIPDAGPVILVANHSTAYDPVCMQVACRRRLIRFMQAREYYEIRPMRYFYRWLGVIPVNRTGNDTASIRTALRALSAGGCVGIFPEGKISEDGALHEPHKGVALLALMSNATVVPAYLQGTRPFLGMIRDFLQFNRVTLYFGEPIRFDDLGGRHRDADARDAALERIMAGIVALRDLHAPASPRGAVPSE